MARYGIFRYGTDAYGVTARTASTSAMFAQVIDYGTVRLTVYADSRLDSRYALVRTKNGAAEEPSSGITVRTGTVTSPEFVVIDGPDNLSDTDIINNVDVPVGPVYYTLFVFDGGGNWYKDAATYTVVPRNRDSVRMMIQMLPRVFTTASQDPLDQPDETGELFRFLKGFAVSVDEAQTYIDRVLPVAARSRATVAGLHDAHCRSVGMPVEYILGLASTSRLFRDAGVAYQNKGKVSGVRYFAEALTGWSVDVRESPNRLLSVDDSSFEAGLGIWDASEGTLTWVGSGEEVTAPESEYDLERDPLGAAGVARLALSGSTARMDMVVQPAVGAVAPSTGRVTYTRLGAIPVFPGEDVYASFYAQASDDADVTPIVTWLDESGAQAGSEDRGSAAPVSGTWQRVKQTFTVPSEGRFMLLSLEAEGDTGTAVYVDKIQVADTDTHYHEPQSVDLVCHPARVNLLTRPTTDDPILWSAETGTIEFDLEDSYLGTYCLLGTATGEVDVRSERVPALAGSILSASAYVKSDQPATLDVVFYDEKGSVTPGPEFNADTAEITDVGIPRETLGTGQWEPVQVRFLTPPDAVEAAVRVVGTDSVRLDAVIMERTDRQQFYFDSIVADASGEDALAVVDGDRTYSVLYPGRLPKASRLNSTLQHYLRLGVTSRILFWSDDDPHARQYIPYQP